MIAVESAAMRVLRESYEAVILGQYCAGVCQEAVAFVWTNVRASFRNIILPKNAHPTAVFQAVVFQAVLFSDGPFFVVPAVRRVKR